MYINPEDSYTLEVELRKLFCKTSKAKKLYGPEIIKILNQTCILKTPFTEAKLRHLVNKLRRSAFPIMSSSDGYWISWNEEEILECIQSLKSRITGIQAASLGLEECIKSIRETNSQFYTKLDTKN